MFMPSSKADHSMRSRHPTKARKTTSVQPEPSKSIDHLRRRLPMTSQTTHVVTTHRWDRRRMTHSRCDRHTLGLSRGNQSRQGDKANPTISRSAAL